MLTRVLMRPVAAIRASAIALVALVMGLALATLIGYAAPASAHSELAESTPAAGSTITKAPTEVELVFGEGVQEQGGSIVVSVRDTIVSQDNTFAVQDNVASVQLQGATQPGTYRVAFRIVSDDGHTVRDTFTYELNGSTASSTYNPTDAPETAAPSTSPLAGESSSDDGNGAVVWVLGLGAIGLALVAALIAVAVRGRRDRSS